MTLASAATADPEWMPHPTAPPTRRVRRRYGRRAFRTTGIRSAYGPGRAAPAGPFAQHNRAGREARPVREPLGRGGRLGREAAA